MGEIGRLHIDSGVYERVLGDIDSPALIVSTKFTTMTGHLAMTQ